MSRQNTTARHYLLGRYVRGLKRKTQISNKTRNKQTNRQATTAVTQNLIYKATESSSS